MDQVYKYARIVIIAATGNSADDGLPGISVRREPPPVINVGCFTFRQMPPYDIEVFQGTKWATRGWTFQEGYLFCRRLFFSNSRTFFVCDDKIFPELIPSAIELCGSWSSRVMRGPMHKVASSYRNLARNIEEYSSRTLTHDSDSLRAFLGVFDDYRGNSTHQLHHLWGVPVFQEETTQAPFIVLDWVHIRGELLRRRRGFPSWSWAGWAGKLRFPDMPTATVSMVYIDQDRTLPLEPVYQHLSSSNAPPKLLYLRSDVTEVTFIPKERFGPTEITTPSDVVAIVPFTDTEHIAGQAWMDEPVEMMTPYSAILLGVKKLLYTQETLLVIKKTNDHFERVGLVILPTGGADPMAYYGFRSTDLSYGVVELSQLESSIPLRQQKWFENSEERTVCLG